VTRSCRFPPLVAAADSASESLLSLRTAEQSYSYYIESYPLDPAVLGFVTYPFILDNGCGEWH
jgi:hypothetical protein